MLQRFLVEVRVNLAEPGILTSELLQVLLHDKLLPDLGDLAVEAACLAEGALDSEKLAHVEVTATQLVRLGTVEAALQEDALRQLFERFLVSLIVALSEEQTTEGLVQSGTVVLDVLLCHERHVVSLRIIR